MNARVRTVLALGRRGSGPAGLRWKGAMRAAQLVLAVVGQSAVALDAVTKDHAYTAKQLSKWQAGTKDPIWNNHIDRRYMRDTMFPEAGRLAGNFGNVLEVGYMPFNADDCVLAGLDPKQYYFVDPNTRSSFVKSSGTLLRGKLVDLLPEKRHQFAVIIDYGVLGYLLSEMVEKEPQNVEAHLRAYHELLTAGGAMFLKLDTGSGKDFDREPGQRSSASRNIFLWTRAIEMISQFDLELVSMEAHYSDGVCPSQLVTALTNVTSGRQRAVRPAKKLCESYLYSRWKAR